MCDNNAECLYDYAATGNPNLAADTLAAIQWDAKAREMSEPGIQCTFMLIVSEACIV